MTVRWRNFLACVVLALAAACGEGDGDDGEGGVSGGGFLVFSRPDGIYQLSLEDNALTPLIVPTQPSEYILDPAVSPDGTQIAYIVQPPARSPSGAYDAGSDLWIAARDGSGARMLYKHEQPNALVRLPRWLDDGRVAAIVQELSQQPFTGATDVRYTVQAFDAEGGERERLLDDALAFAFSPDGGRIAYARLVPGQGEVLESAGLEGGGATPLVSFESQVNPFASPRYSPDGERIAFAAADQTTAPTPPTGRLVSAGRMQAPALDGLPQDIWTVDATGGRPRLLAELKEDLPSLDWTDDGRRIYVLGGGGLYEVNVENGAVETIGEGVFHGVVDWTATGATP